MDFDKDLRILIGKRISEIRVKNNQTQHDLEFLTGIDSADISKYEKGKRNLTLKTMIRFSIALQVHPKELFEFELDITKYEIEDEI
ncbi:helix-turn-helix domain-containing protein [Chryseobacterium camelliae]|uniref:helix-turn-helix domain-containing protein n=1 Tax=Chryseobacterium camelliae TaxID=1265445 RepID=UPI000C1CB06F|nr:helix-turn-helix transcriptional regulator [Chryseobacterium camelliae]